MREMEKHEMLFDVQSGQSGLVNGHVTQPTAPSKPRKTKRRCLTQMDLLAQKSNKGLPPLGTFHTGKKFLPRCCAIGTCITASKQSKILNDKVLRKTTCGSCRTCSLNMCVVQTNASSVTYADRAKQADYGNVLDHGGHPRNCVHCCCDFKPTQKNGCSADDCPLHFNNCVDQITNYARLESHNRIELGEKMSLRRERLHQLQQVMPAFINLYFKIVISVFCLFVCFKYQYLIFYCVYLAFILQLLFFYYYLKKINYVK